MNKVVEKVLDYWFEIPKPVKHVTYGFGAGFVFGLLL